PAGPGRCESLARCAGRNLRAGRLTGMGKDGARGLLAIRQAGGYTLAQDEATCVVYGMPREAVELGAAEDVLPLERIAAALLQQAARRGSGNRL
ncbi:chemotaxis response regulator protein-glutamate methylesterase, partial [Pseudomonas aeruginosa]|nr:chemotaxis response regulator protein-glutamate methylesterase [Pseudomonas aeruginosa]